MVLIQWIWVMIVRWQSDLINAKEKAHLLFVTNLNRNKRKVQKEEDIKVLRNRV